MEERDRIQAIVVSRKNNRIEAEVIPELVNDLTTFKNIIECKTLTAITRKINNKKFIFFCDDEGRLRKKLITMLCFDCDEVLAGNIIITTSDDEGDTCGISDEDAEMIMSWFKGIGYMYHIHDIVIEVEDDDEF